MANTSDLSDPHRSHSRGRFGLLVPAGGLLPLDPTKLVGVVLFFAVWYLGHVLIGPYLPMPHVVIGTALRNLVSSAYFVGIGLPEGGYMPHLLSTTRTAMLGCLVGGAIGILSGLLSAHSAVVYQITRPVAAFLGTIPILVAAPFFLIWFGVSDLAKIVLVAFYSAVALHINALRAVEILPPHYLDYARTLGAGHGTVFWRISFPGSVPQLFGGLRNALGAAWGLAAITEILGTQHGLGRVIIATWSVQDITTMMGGLFLLSLIAVVADAILMAARARALRWADTDT
ncbi:ABC transporter permease [Amaricoccus tamworthensis]|uniref:ABC transporter permease n=1 Tax=Amaricoccus tamworthensis TaxID=57002 RepID=UPI003C79842F